MLANASYGSMPGGSFGYGRKGKFPAKQANKRGAFTAEYAIRSQNAQTERCGALHVIGSGDMPETFFSCDPPYAGAGQGHCDGFAQDDYGRLPGTPARIKGQFLLSSYRNKALTGFIERLGWDSAEIKMCLNMSGRTESCKRARKIEVLAANYPIADKVRP
jgi:DNA adenine methylase